MVYRVGRENYSRTAVFRIACLRLEERVNEGNISHLRYRESSSF